MRPSWPLSFVKWEEAYSQGNDLIDDLHHSILANLNALYFYANSDSCNHLVGQCFDVLVKNMELHVLTEESLLHDIHASTANEYRLNSQILLAKFIAISEQAKGDMYPAELLSFIRTWWTEHMKYHQYLEPFLIAEKQLFCRI